MASTSRFVYEIRAEYTEKSSLERLQADLEKIGKIDAYKKQEEQAARLEERLKKLQATAAKQSAKASGGDAGAAARYAKTAASIKSVTAQLAALKTDMAKAETDLKKNGVAVGNLAAEYDKLQAATKKAGQAQAARGVLGLPDHKDIAAQIRQVQEARKRLVANGDLTLLGRAQSWVTMKNRIQDLRNQTNGWGQQLANIRGAWMQILGVFGSARLVGSGLRQYAQFNDAMKTTQAIAGATAADFEMLKKQAMELGATTRYTAADAANGMTQLAAAGLTAQQIYESLPAAMDMAALSGLDVATAADQLTNIMSQFGIESSEATRVADVLTGGFTGAATSMQQLADAFTYVGPVANAFGYSIEETTAALMTLANSGFKASMGGTALRRILSALSNEESTAGKQLEEYGIQVRNAEGGLRNLADILDEIKAKGMGEAEIMQIFGERGGPGMLALIQQGGDAIRQFTDRLENAGGMARQKAGEIENDIGGAFRRLSAAVTAIGIAFGEHFAPRVTKLADALAGIAAKIAELPGWTKEIAAVTGALAALVALRGPVLMLRNAVTLLGAAQLTGLAGTLGKLKAAMTGVGGAAGAFSALGAANPVLLGVIAALGAATVAWKLFGDAAGGAADKHAKAADKIAGGIEADKKRIQELRDLQKTLLETASGTKEHTEAEEKLAKILPGANTRIDEQGRLVADLKDKTDENNRKLEEHIALLEKRGRVMETERLKETALAYVKEGEAVERNAKKARELHEANRGNLETMDLLTAQSGGYKAALDATLASADRLGANFDKRKAALDGLLRSMAQSGTTVSQFYAKLGEMGLPADAKAKLVDEYRAVMEQVKAEANKAAEDIKNNAAKVNDEQVGDAKVTAKELSQAYKGHVEEVRRLQEEISGRQKSLTAELRDMARGGMSDADAWVDQRKAAQEYIKLAKQAADEARRAQAGGDSITAALKWKEAVQYADDAKAAYKALNHEVKSGDQVIISSQTALKGAMRGVKEAGELGISFLKEQEQAAASAAREMEKTTSMADLTSEMSAAEKTWTEGWRKMRGEVEETAKVMQEYWQNAAGFFTNTDDAFSAGWSKGVVEFEATMQDSFAKFERRGKEAAENVGKEISGLKQNAAGFWTNVEDEFSAGFSKSADAIQVNLGDAMASFEKRGKEAANSVDKSLDKMARDRTTTLFIKEQRVKAARWGGLIEAARYQTGGVVERLRRARELASGGRLPGYGGGDRISALLEAGEFVVRKEAVKKFGAGFFQALNSLKMPRLPELPDLSALLPQIPQPAAALPGGGHMVLELKLPGGEAVAATVSGDDAEKLARFNRRVSNTRYRR